MNPSQIIFTFFEILLVAAVFLGIFFEYKLINFEIALKEKIKKIWELIF